MTNDKKLSCRRETARRVVSLNILLSHSRSLKLVRNYTVEQGVCKSTLVSCIVSEIWRDLETGVRCHSRSFKMVPFDRRYTTFCWSAIVNIALFCIVFELFDVIVTLKWVRGHTSSFKLVPLGSLGPVSYLPSIVTMVLSFPSYSEVLVKNRDFFTPPCIRRPLQGIPVRTLPSRYVRTNRNGLSTRR